MGRDDYLFSSVDWHSVDRHQRDELAREIAALDANRLLNTSVDDLAKYFSDKYQISVPELDLENLVVDERETKIDVSQDQFRLIRDRSRPFYMSGTAIDVEIPFIGDPEACKVRPSTYSLNPPRASVRGSSIIFSIVGTNLDAQGVKGHIDSMVESIQINLRNLRDGASRLNSQLPEEAKNAIETRRAKLLASRNMVAALGFKMKERGGVAKTFVPTEVRRKIGPIMPAASTAPFKPEPALSNEDYEHILSVMQNMTQVMELSPSAFHSVNEEALRSHFPVQLNGHYQGQATAETFNYEGKTDILIRVDGKNIFIAECKFWAGPQKLTETIDQLLGYSSWRDTKTAVVIFNRNRDFSKVLAAIPETVRTHPKYKRDLSGSTETTFRYQFANRDDPNRELFLTVLTFDVPTPRA